MVMAKCLVTVCVIYVQVAETRVGQLQILQMKQNFHLCDRFPIRLGMGCFALLRTSERSVMSTNISQQFHFTEKLL
eukprot:4157707-Amphidinium_carterae.1